VVSQSEIPRAGAVFLLDVTAVRNIDLIYVSWKLSHCSFRIVLIHYYILANQTASNNSWNLEHGIGKLRHNDFSTCL